MKKIVLVAFFAIMTSFVYSQGIEFFKGTFEEAKAKAKRENKKIFVDVFTTWCGPCKMMSKNVFPDKQVGDFFNKNFVSMKLDAENQASHDFFKSYKATSYPSYFWVDENGVLLDTGSGSTSPEGFIQMAEKALKSNLGVVRTELKKRWDNGERTESVVRDYVLGALPEINPGAVRPAMIEYLNTLTPEQLQSRETYMLFKGFCQPRNGYFEDDIISKTYLKNIKQYESYDNKYSSEIQGFGNVMYRTFVRFHTGVYLNLDFKEADKKVAESIKYIKGLDFVYKDMFIECIGAEKLIYTGKYAEGISKMNNIIAKYGEQFPTLRGNFIYTLAMGNYFISENKPKIEDVLKMATDDLKISPSKTSVIYYAAANYAAGNYKEAYSALGWTHFYEGKQVSNAVFEKFGISDNFRSRFPVSTPATDAEKARVKNMGR